MLSLDDLLDDMGIMVECSLVKDHRRITVQRMSYGKARLIAGRPVPHTDKYYDLEDGWCYLSCKAALDALAAWDPEEDKKPDGWMRDTQTGQYRIGGRADLEYVKNPMGGTLKEIVGYAISVTRGEPHIIKELKQTRAHSLLPDETQHFVATSESPMCPHDPVCQPISHVYQRFDRWVVLSMEQFYDTTVDNVWRRLTSDNGAAWQDRNLGYLAELYGMSVVRLG